MTLFAIREISEFLPPLNSISCGHMKEGLKCELRGDYRTAEFFLESGLKMKSFEKKSADSLAYLIKLGIVKWHLGKMAEASESFVKALSAVDLLVDLKEDIFFCYQALDIISLYQEGKIARSEGRMLESNRMFSDAIDKSTTLGKGGFAGKCYRQLGVNYWEQSRLEEYYYVCMEALKLSICSKNRKRLEFVATISDFIIGENRHFQEHCSL